jgi:hypothetical protein
VPRDSEPSDFNDSIYYRHKLEFSVESGFFPIDIPFPFDFLLGSGYNFPGLYYTLLPTNAYVRWQVNDVGGRSVFRGNWEFSAGANFTAIPRGAETRFGGYVMGVRRNFVRRRWRVAPYFDGHVGIGGTDAKGPDGVAYAQGQDLTFTLMLGSGARYNINQKYSLSAGLGYMHVSNMYLSEPKYLNYGINVYGPMFAFYMRLGDGRHHGIAAKKRSGEGGGVGN